MHLTLVTPIYCSVLVYVPCALFSILRPGRTGVMSIPLLFYLLSLVLNPNILIGVYTKDYTKIEFYLNILNKDKAISLR